jgi:tetratricopeptide (TPR) repeat protein
MFSCSLMPNELKRAEQLIETAPDSALQILQHLSPDKYKSDQNRALYGLLIIQTLDKKLLPLKPDSLLNFAMSYYQEHPDNERLAKCYFYKARLYKYSSLYEQAMNYYLKALDQAKNSENNFLLGRINLDLGEIYCIQKDFVLSRKKFQLAHSYFSKAKSQFYAFYSLLSIGETYHYAKEYKIAQNYYRRILNQAKDSLEKGSLYQDMGINFYDFKKYDSAYYYFKEILNYPYVKNNKSLRYLYLSNIYFDSKQCDSASYYAKTALQFNPDINTQQDCYRLMTNCEFINGHTKNVTIYMSKYVKLGDSIRKIDAQIKGSYIETMHSTRQEVEKKQSWLWYLGAILLIVIITSVSVYIVKHRKGLQKLQLSEENSQIQRADIRKEVMLKHRDALLRKIEDRKSSHTEEWKKASPADRERIDRKMYEELLHLNDIEFFYKEMDTVLNNMVTKLQTRYQLNQKEIQWCCLYLLNVSNQDIMMLLDYTPDALKKMRQRLAKTKFGINSLKELEAFLFRILTE